MFRSNLKLKSSIIGGSVLLSILIYFYVIAENLPADITSLKLDETFGLLALLYLILVMLPGPLYRLYPNFPFKNNYRASLGGLGISTFYFAFLHSWFGFFGTLHGFAGLPFLDSTYILADILGLIALLILAIMAATSFTWAMQKLGQKWKLIHKFVYLVAIALILHVILIGADFRDFTQPITLLFVLAFLVLVILYSISTYRYLVFKYPNVSTRVWRTTVSVILIGSLYLLFILHEFIIGGHVH